MLNESDVPLGCMSGADSPDPSDVDEIEGEESMDVESLGGIGRMFGAVISRFAHIPIPTQISPEVIRAAKEICLSGALDGTGAADDRLCDLVWGWEFEGKVERQAACFFRVTVDARQAENGLLISCRSYSKGKFKLLTFDHNGEVVHHEDSCRSTAIGVSGRSEATLYFTRFETYRLGDSVPDALKEDDVPSVLGKLENFMPSRLSIQKGQHLICVYGDNFIGKTSFTIVAVPSLNDCPDVAVMKELDVKVLTKRADMSSLRDEYLEARAKFQALERRVKEESVAVQDLITNRDAAYINYLESSVRAYQPMDVDDVMVDSGDSLTAYRGSWMDGVSSGVSAGKGMLLSGLQGGLQNAPSTASAATGWIAASFTTGFDKINKMMGSSHSRDASEDQYDEDIGHHQVVPPDIASHKADVNSSKDNNDLFGAMPDLPHSSDEVLPVVEAVEEEDSDDKMTRTLIQSSEIPEGVVRYGSGGSIEDLPAVLVPPRNLTLQKEVSESSNLIHISPLQKPALPGSHTAPDLSI